MKITLNHAQIERAALQGCMRQIESMKRGQTHLVQEPEAPFENNIQASGAELAVTLAYHGRWTGEGTYGKPGPDVTCRNGMGLHVRWTKHPMGRLIVRPTDPHGCYVLVRGRMPEYDIIGAMWFDPEDPPDDRHAHWMIPGRALHQFIREAV